VVGRTIPVLVLIWLSSDVTARVLAQETSDQRYERLLAVALKEPDKANWKELRRAFSKTSHYDPYNIDVDEKLKEVAQSIGRGEFQKSEKELLKLVDHDRYMRFDSVAMLMMLYDKMEQPEESKKYRKIIDGILGVLEYPKAGVSIENPIEVLFVQEEYLVATNMHIKEQALLSKDGHRYDVLTTEAVGDKPERKLYFNIDLLRNPSLRVSRKK
jgi:hypothetical protein